MTRFRPRLAIVLPFVIVLAVPARADEVSDALQAAVDAYAAGDLPKVSDRMTLATKALGL